MADTETDTCSLTLVRRVAALLDHDPAAWRDGMPLPRGWEFILFTPVTPQSALRPDGHHYTDPGAPPGGATRVVLGGRRVAYAGHIPVGATVTRSSEVTGEAIKDGGRLRIVTRRHTSFVDGNPDPVITEDEDMIYRVVTEAAPAAKSPPPVVADPNREPYVTDETMLFRYSVLTNNAHRIHYDLGFATGTEGYPGLVVNGGLTTLRLVESFRRLAGREPERVTTRMVRPLFCGRANAISHSRGADGEWRIWAETETGALAAEARIS